MEEKTLSGVGPLPTAAEEPETIRREPTSYDDNPELAESVAAFDLDAWVRGMTNIRRAVTIYGDVAGNAEIDVLDSREREARLRGASTKEIRAIVMERSAVAKRVADSALDIVFEGRTADWLKRVAAEAKKNGLDGTELVSAVMDGQIVSPEGVDAELLNTISEVSPGQYMKLMAMWKQVNAEAGVDLPF